MQVIFDVVTKSATVIFQGKVYMINGPFSNRDAAVKAAELKCRELGWQGGSTS